MRRGPGLVGTMARTAVVAGTAAATSHAVHNRMNRGAQQEAEVQYAQQQAAQAQADMYAMQAQMAAQQQAAPPPQPASGGVSQDTIQQLQQLAQLKDQGILTEEEFQKQKQKLLGS